MDGRDADEFPSFAVFHQRSVLKSPWEAVFVGAVSSFGILNEELSSASVNAFSVRSWRVGGRLRGIAFSLAAEHEKWDGSPARHMCRPTGSPGHDELRVHSYLFWDFR